MYRMKFCNFWFINIVFFAFFGLITNANALCTKDGTSFPVGQFDDPSDPCSTCDCKDDGTFTCSLKACPATPCGAELLRLSADGCCMVCPRQCEGVVCPAIDCPEDRLYFAPDNCCPECGCRYKGEVVNPGYFGHPCDSCRCRLNGEVRCRRPACPTVRPQCVDPDFDADCNYICPNGKTCKQGLTVIKYGEFKIVGKKVCTCVGDWYPRAFCNQRISISAMETLEKERCVADATNFSAWQEIEALYYEPVETPPPLL